MDLQEFSVLAKNYVATIEDFAGKDPPTFLTVVGQQLATIYAAIAQIPLAFPEDDRPDDPVSAEKCVQLRAGLCQMFGPGDAYRSLFDPYESEAEVPVVRSLADDLVDIYGELYRGLYRWEAGDQMEASYEWRFGFEYHWGRHLTSGLRAMFALEFEHRWDVPPLSEREA